MMDIFILLLKWWMAMASMVICAGVLALTVSKLMDVAKKG